MFSQQLWMVAVQADTASANERERLALAFKERVADHAERIVLDTCHRVELYGFGTIPDLGARLRVEVGESAVQHLMRVAAGLESAIAGEDEVLHQVREALRTARTSRSLDGRLQRLFETAIAAGRRARAGRTASGSLAQRAVAWLQQRSVIAGRPVLVAGAGRMGSALAHAATLAGAEVIVASRDPAKAHRLAQVYRGRGIDLASGAQLAPDTAGVAVALAGAWNEFQPLERQLPPIADMSAPPAVSEAIRERLKGGFLSIDDLYVQARTIPRGYIDEAERVVARKTGEYVGWLKSRP